MSVSTAVASGGQSRPNAPPKTRGAKSATVKSAKAATHPMKSETPWEVAVGYTGVTDQGFPTVRSPPSIREVEAINRRNAAAYFAQRYDPFSHEGQRFPDDTCVPSAVTRFYERVYINPVTDGAEYVWGIQVTAGIKASFRKLTASAAGALTWGSWTDATGYTSWSPNAQFYRTNGVGVQAAYEGRVQSLIGTLSHGQHYDAAAATTYSYLDNWRADAHTPVIQDSESFAMKTMEVFKYSGPLALESPVAGTNWRTPDYAPTGTGNNCITYLMHNGNGSGSFEAFSLVFTIVKHAEYIPLPLARPFVGVAAVIPGAFGELGLIDAMIRGMFDQMGPQTQLALAIAANRVAAQFGAFQPYSGAMALSHSGMSEPVVDVALPVPVTRGKAAFLGGMFSKISKGLGLKGVAKELGGIAGSGLSGALGTGNNGQLLTMLLPLLLEMFAGSQSAAALATYHAALAHYYKTGEEGPITAARIQFGGASLVVFGERVRGVIPNAIPFTSACLPKPATESSITPKLEEAKTPLDKNSFWGR